MLDKLNQLFDAQTQLGNPHVSGSLKATVCDLLMTQCAALSVNDLLEMFGKYMFEPNEYKAENVVFMEMKAWHAIGTTFSIYKTDDEISVSLNYQLPENEHLARTIN